MKKFLLDNGLKFFKANLHCHSTYSDGRLTVEELKSAYKARGYSVVAFTDHEHVIDNSRLDDEEFLTITSCEVAIKEFPEKSTLVDFQMRVCHLNFYALDQHNDVTPCYSSVYDHFVNDQNRGLIKFDAEYERKYTADGINEMIKIANEKRFIVSYNHPDWSLENATDYLAYENLFAVEICNGGTMKAGFSDDERAFADLLSAGKRVYCTAADDNHNATGFDSPDCDSFGGWVEINADKLEYGEIMRALRAGNFYASTGPKIFSLALNGDRVEIECSPCKQIVLITGGRRREVANAADGETLTSAVFSLRESDGYFRLRIIDEQGKKAYTQAYAVKI